jgi:putative NADH-flavin reductase
MNILVFGASGATGHELVKQALAQEHVVTAFVRAPEKLKIQHDNLKVVQGDVKNYASVERGVKGQDAVLSALGASGPFKYDQVVVDGMAHIVQAMEQLHVKRFIYQSFIGVKESRNDFSFFFRYIAPKILRTEIAGHEARERIIRQSMLDWTIVRPPTLTNGKHKGVYRSGEDLKSKSFIVTISRADVADFMLKQLTDTTFVREAVRVMY